MRTLPLNDATLGRRRLRAPVVLALGLDSAMWVAIFATIRMIPL